MTLLPAETLDLGNRQTLNTSFAQGLPDILQLERLNDCRD
jgi:hypothetical protein